MALQSQPAQNSRELLKNNPKEVPRFYYSFVPCIFLLYWKELRAEQETLLVLASGQRGKHPMAAGHRERECKVRKDF